MKIQTVKSIHFKGKLIRPGLVIDVPDDLAKKLLEAGIASPPGEKKKAPPATATGQKPAGQRPVGTTKTERKNVPPATANTKKES